jgi:hypothetical protein
MINKFTSNNHIHTNKFGSYKPNSSKYINKIFVQEEQKPEIKQEIKVENINAENINTEEIINTENINNAENILIEEEESEENSDLIVLNEIDHNISVFYDEKIIKTEENSNLSKKSEWLKQHFVRSKSWK